MTLFTFIERIGTPVVVGICMVLAAWVAVTDVGRPSWAIPTGRAVAFQAEPVPVSSASPLPSLSQDLSQRIAERLIPTPGHATQHED